ncbi:hypothetical protein [Roseateles sp.]|uniref:hypothetical protein n=1 Tax=Roseateles sp. TaxID=1971397 RepID=UPI0039EADCB4
MKLAAAALLLAAGAAHSGCTRTIVVPGALQGRLVMVDGSVVRGVFPDLLRELGAALGCEFVFPQLPRARAERDFFNDHVGDIFFPAVRRPERDSGNVFLSVGRQPLAVFAPRGVAIPERLDQLMADVRLRGVFMRGIWLGDTYGRTLEALGAQGRLDLVSDYGAMVRMLKAGAPRSR